MNVRAQAWRLLAQLLFRPANVTIDMHELELPVWLELVNLANLLLVSPALWHALNNHHGNDVIPGDIADYLHTLYQINENHNLVQESQCLRIARALNDRGIVPLVFKGIAHSLTNVFDNPGDRYIGDIDLLCPEDSLAVAKDTLIELGFTEVISSIDPATHWHIHPLIDSDLGIRVELHRSMIPSQTSCLLSIEEQWAMSHKLPRHDCEILVPSPTASIMLAIIHSELIDACLDRFTLPLKTMVDVFNISKKQDPEIDYKFIFSRLSDLPRCRCMQRFVSAFRGASGSNLSTEFNHQIRDHFHYRLTLLSLYHPAAHLWLDRLARISPLPLLKMTMSPAELRKAKASQALLILRRFYQRLRVGN